LGKIENCYFVHFHDDESHWQTEDHNGQLVRISYSLSALGFRDSARQNAPMFDSRFINGWDKKELFDDRLAQNFVRFFQGEYWQFKPNGEPSIRAMRTGDGKTVEPLDNLELLRALQKHGHAQFPDKMIHYMEALGAARS
jgi:hypothetical protein